MPTTDTKDFIATLHQLSKRRLGMDDRIRSELASQFAIEDPDAAGCAIAVLVSLLGLQHGGPTDAD